MRAVLLDGGFGRSQLKLVELPAPSPGPGQVLLRMSAVSLNYRDLLMVEGSYYPNLELPLIVASDGVGEVVALGAGVTEPALGTRVCPLFAPDWLEGSPPRGVFKTTLGGPRDGTLSEFMVVGATSVLEVPDYLSDEQAACLPCAALTAYSALVTLGELCPGEHVLCLGTGGVSLFALAFAKALGARVTITSKSPEKLAAARELGADNVLDYRQHPDFGQEVRQRFGDVDHVIEVGGVKTLGQSLASLRNGGTVSLIGVLAGHTGPVNLMPILMRQLRVQGVFVGSKRSFERMLSFMEIERTLPVIGKVFDLTEFGAAFESLANQDHFGKVCVKLR